MPPISSIAKLIRLPQWIKNVFIFLPLFFSENLFKSDHLLPTFLTFLIFSLTASTVYIINDYRDISEDRNHPIKRFRPLAAGIISKSQAWGLGLGLFFSAIALTLWFVPEVIWVIGIYFFLNIGYSFGLKKIALLDVIIIAIGFLLRVIAGGEASHVFISKWILLLTFLLALILAFGKRRGELVTALKQSSGSKTRSALDGYNLPFIDASIIFMSAVTVVSYILYTVSDEVVARLENDNLYLTSFFVLIGLVRYLQLALVFNRTEAPTKLIYTDVFLQIVVLAWLLVFGYFLYY